ncbi:hypothetical protein A4H97_30415 [Niastella yeongjuensis]|uniref:Uncharacterized protein n=1 Tax=Niastella yeongjuensis TaxID=354355 RepID=A0A1V9EPB0_9BACT|nr:hypothetical protein [Niastella yeongjuensis]OQP47921.1 hypothetical protein A4H97_30415 [Niastella yeongjuensis]SEP47996.1 hypothetical protein SAMN05660816_06681 [Niastella yeongjuensis]
MKLHVLVLCPVIVAVLSGSMISPKQVATTQAALYKDSIQHTSLFSLDDVERIKEFFLTNTALPEQPKDSGWRPGFRHKCINTVRAGLDYLIFGESSIPDSLYSRHGVLNGHDNDITDLAKRLHDGHYIRSYDTVRFLSLRKDEWVPITKADPVSRGLPPMALEKSLWNTLLRRIGKERGFSVFLLSVCDGYHAALLTLDHRNPAAIKVYWADQTHRHPLRYFVNNKLEEVPGKYGWEVMQANGPAKHSAGLARGLDEYMLLANQQFWCDCGRPNQKPGDCCSGNCFPSIQIWRIQKVQSL